MQSKSRCLLQPVASAIAAASVATFPTAASAVAAASVATSPSVAASVTAVVSALSSIVALAAASAYCHQPRGCICHQRGLV